MDNYQKRVVAALRRAKWFLEKYFALIGTDEVGPAVAQLEEAINGIAADTSEKVKSDKLARSGTVTKYDLRRELRDLMNPVSVIAQGRLVGMPDTQLAKFNLPSKNASDVALIAGARAMASAAADYRPAFQSYGRPADFVEALIGAADALESKIVERDGERLGRRRALLGIQVKLAKARTLLRLISGIVVRKLWGQPDLVGMWRAAIKIGGHPAPVPEEEAAPAETPAPAASLTLVKHEQKAAA